MAEKMFKTLIFVETSLLNYLLFFASVAKFIQFQTINTTQISDFENYSIYFFIIQHGTNVHLQNWAIPL